MTLAQQDPHLVRLVAEIKAAEAALAARLADLHVYIGQGDHSVPTAPAASAFVEPERRADLIGKEWIEVSTAAQRFEISKEVVRSWCQRNKDFGWRPGGRWYVSISKVQAKLGIR